MNSEFQEFSEAQWIQFKSEAEQVKDLVESKIFIHLPNPDQGNYPSGQALYPAEDTLLTLI